MQRTCGGKHGCHFRCCHAAPKVRTIASRPPAVNARGDKLTTCRHPAFAAATGGEVASVASSADGGGGVGEPLFRRSKWKIHLKKEAVERGFLSPKDDSITKISSFDEMLGVRTHVLAKYACDPAALEASPQFSVSPSLPSCLCGDKLFQK